MESWHAATPVHSFDARARDHGVVDKAVVRAVQHDAAASDAVCDLYVFHRDRTERARMEHV